MPDDDTQPELFPEFIAGAPRAPLPSDLSDDRRRTERQHRLASAGVHPLTRRAALSTTPGATCGSCLYREPGRFPKCWWRPGATGLRQGGHGPYPNISAGPATDCRAWWPGCDQWAPHGRD